MRPPLPVDSMEPYDVPRSHTSRARDVVSRAPHGFHARFGDHGWPRGRAVGGWTGRLRDRLGRTGGDDMRAAARRPDRPAGERHGGGTEPAAAGAGARRDD